MAKATRAEKLEVALSLALTEIHNPGANRSAGIDIIAICEGLLAQRAGDTAAMASEELADRAADPLRTIVNAIGNGAFR